MLGNIMVNSEELKGKEFKVYRQFYCGVCQDLRDEYGQPARLTWNEECSSSAGMVRATLMITCFILSPPCRVCPDHANIIGKKRA